MDRCDDATELYGSLQESELSSACGIALAHFKANRHAEAYVTYEAALHWLASDDEKRSHLLVAMAMAAFRRDFPDAEAIRTHHHTAIRKDPPTLFSHFFTFFHIYSLLFKDVCTINCSKKE
jgi:hypothetical protein